MILLLLLPLLTRIIMTLIINNNNKVGCARGRRVRLVCSAHKCIFNRLIRAQSFLQRYEANTLSGLTEKTPFAELVHCAVFTVSYILHQTSNVVLSVTIFIHFPRQDYKEDPSLRVELICGSFPCLKMPLSEGW